MRRGSGGRGFQIAGALLGVVVVLAVLAQLLLPWLAAKRITSRVARYGHVVSVSVSAWPALKLLWGDADSVKVRTGDLAMSAKQASDLLWEGRGVEKMDLNAQAVRMGKLQVQDALLRKRGSSLEAEAQASEAEAQAALPGVSLKLLGSGGGQVKVLAGGSLFGVGASVEAVAEADEGELIAHPLGFLLEGFRLTLFSEQHVHVEGVGAHVLGSDPLVYGLKMSALLH
jgi:LmeA-like phospholipid-binding